MFLVNKDYKLFPCFFLKKYNNNDILNLVRKDYSMKVIKNFLESFIRIIFIIFIICIVFLNLLYFKFDISRIFYRQNNFV